MNRKSHNNDDIIYCSLIYGLVGWLYSSACGFHPPSLSERKSLQFDKNLPRVQRKIRNKKKKKKKKTQNSVFLLFFSSSLCCIWKLCFIWFSPSPLIFLYDTAHTKQRKSAIKRPPECIGAQQLQQLSNMMGFYVCVLFSVERASYICSPRFLRAWYVFLDVLL